MSIAGLARVALGAPEWVAAWKGVGDYFREKLEANELDDPIAWAGLRGDRKMFELMLKSMNVLSDDEERAKQEVDWCQGLQGAARPGGAQYIDASARLPDLCLPLARPS